MSRATPNKISLSSDVFFGSEAVIEGSHIRIENQIRRVQKVDLPIIIVDRPFEEVNTSDLSYIFPPHTPVEVIFHAGGVRSTCTDGPTPVNHNPGYLSLRGCNRERCERMRALYSESICDRRDTINVCVR